MGSYNVLVVDDEVSNLHALERTLRREYNVLSATNGEDALLIMKQNDVALIIADYRMPGMSGIQLLEKTLQKYPDTIRVILTAYTDERLLMDAVNTAHAHGYLTKPWEPEEITSTVGKWIEAHEALQSPGTEKRATERLTERTLPEEGTEVAEEFHSKEAFEKLEEIANYLKEQTERKEQQLQEKERQIENFQRQLEELHQSAEAKSQRHDTIVMQLSRQLDQSQRLLEYHQASWWRKRFGKRRIAEGEAR